MGKRGGGRDAERGSVSVEEWGMRLSRAEYGLMVVAGLMEDGHLTAHSQCHHKICIDERFSTSSCRQQKAELT